MMLGSASAYSPFGSVCNTTQQGNTSTSDICSSTGGTGTGSSNPVTVKILKVAKLFDIIIGIAAVIMIIIGGIRFVLSGGESANVAGARNTILYAVVGLIVAVVAQLILALVINNIK